MGYSLAGRYVNCWACGPHGLVETLVAASERPWREIKALLGDLASKPVPERPRGTLILPKGVGPLLPAHVKYLKRRGFDPDEIIKVWRVQGLGLVPDLRWRLFIPIYHQGEVVSWTTRSISDTHSLRYRSAGLLEESLPHKELLYGEDYVRHCVLVQEGPLDAWRIGPGAVATCGTGFSRAQVNRLSRFPVRVVCFDNEPEAQKRARQLCDLLEVFPGETYNVRFSAKDASRSSEREIRRLRRTFLE